MLKRILIPLFLGLFLWLPPLQAGTVLVLGDSLSAAYGMPVEQGWVHLLQQRLPDDRLINASISGDTTAAARVRLPQALAAHQPDILVLELGGNDGLRALPLQEMRANLAAMIEMAQAAGARVLLVGVQLPPNYGPQYTQAFERIFNGLAEEYGTALLPSLVAEVGIHVELMQADGIHPNARAQGQLAELVYRYLHPLLEQVQDG